MRAKLSDIIALFPPELSAVGARDRTGPAVLFVGQDSSARTMRNPTMQPARRNTVAQDARVSPSP